ncbi:MAG TPA: PAS domain-containing sensor histidine kinase, partial [Kiloniellales bacterium]|nr:PAS domain-containing sensor histidine kinase [Kiloniellales bacterium]
LLEAQAGVRSLTEVMVFDSEGRVLGRAGFSLLLDFDPQIPDWAMRRAAGGEVVILTAETDDRVRALYKLDSFGDTYLYVGRLIDARVLQHSDRTQDAVQLYERLEGKRSDLTITFALIFVVVAMMLLLAAVWVGLALATRLTRPIGSLVEAAERVRAGDLGARVDSQDGPDEIGTLSQAFNRMTEELQKKQAEILNANVELDHRSRFIEAVLGGVSAGVIGLDKNGIVTLPNRSACELLETTNDALRGRKLSAVVPEMAELVETARRRPRRLSEKTIALSQGDGGVRRLLVRVTAEADARKVIGYVVTFDDVTELLSAQRKAAWADVARRIAHEIKNPLTPIQLSAERLKRKYRDQIKNDPETFETCTDIIVRHVGDIGRMVDEFSAFARMPAPRLEPTDLTELVRQSAFLQQSAHPDITIAVVQPDQTIVADCDPEHVGRALTNLLQNAVDALEGRAGGQGSAPSPGQIAVRLYEADEHVVVEIEDNGPGLPKAERHRLTEPYVTTRLEGTGLGLAIVKKIMEDHGGRLILEDAPGGGARVKLEFPASERTRRDTETAPEPLKAGSLAHGT